MAEVGSDVQSAAQEFADEHLSMPGVNAIGAGFRITGGGISDEPCIRVLMTRKRPRSFVPNSMIFPDSVRIHGSRLKVDVDEGGPFYSLQVLSLADEVAHTTGLLGVKTDVHTGRVRPAPFGVSIGHVDVTAGTLGGVVHDQTDGSLQVLSNNHVLANSNAGDSGDAIVQPGPADGGGAPDDALAELKRFVSLKWDEQNNADCAIATPSSSSAVINDSASDDVGPCGEDHPAVGLVFAGDCSGLTLVCPAAAINSELQVDFPGGHQDPSSGMIVEKVGRTTGWTAGQVRETGAHAKVSYGTHGTAIFTGVFTVPAFCHGGDSGALVMQAGLP